MPNRISLLVALEGADEGLKRAIHSAERSFHEMSATVKTAGAKAAQGMAERVDGDAKCRYPDFIRELVDDRRRCQRRPPMVSVLQP